MRRPNAPCGRDYRLRNRPPNPLPRRPLAAASATSESHHASGSSPNRSSPRYPSAKPRRRIPGSRLVGGRACLFTGPARRGGRVGANCEDCEGSYCEDCEGSFAHAEGVRIQQKPAFRVTARDTPSRNVLQPSRLCLSQEGRKQIAYPFRYFSWGPVGPADALVFSPLLKQPPGPRPPSPQRQRLRPSVQVLHFPKARQCRRSGHMNRA